MLNIEMDEGGISSMKKISISNLLDKGINFYLCLYLYISFKLNRIDRINLSSMTYENLLFLGKYLTKKEYQEICKVIFESNIRKISLKKKIKVCFLVWLDTAWGTDSLYKKLENNDRFDVSISLLPIHDRKTNIRVEKYYRDKGYKVRKYDKKRQDDDIFFFSTLYNIRSILNYREAKEQRLSALNIWIPYTFWFDKVCDKMFETENASCCWKIYCPSVIHQKIGRRMCRIGMINMDYSGYPKMDGFFKNEEKKAKWKCVNSEAKKIIYAPGYYSMVEDENCSTFEMNYIEIYKYAKEHPQETSWVIRPHPILGKNLVKAKIFSKISDYNNYLDMWSKLPNAEVSIGGDYDELFKTSDGLILDSVSFASGYQYVNKPLLFLKRKEQMDVFNLYGKRLMEVVYQTQGNCYEQIYNFIEDVVINGNDNLKQKRKEFFEQYLNYKKYNGKLASEYIYEDIYATLFNHDEFSFPINNFD